MASGPRPLQAGELVDHRFRIQSRLGSGGAGVVYAVEDLIRDRLVALKLLHEQSSDPRAAEALREEFRVLQSLAHTNIVRVFELGTVDAGTPFYTMELLQGTDLARTPDAMAAADVLEGCCRGLDVLHARGLVHSDLKPSNVFVTNPEKHCKLMDFGLVQRDQRAAAEQPYGTLAYLPPERLSGSTEADPRQDVYALGAILFELLVGHAPYVGQTVAETLQAMHSADLDDDLSKLPSEWRAMLSRMLATEPSQRFAHAWDVLQTWTARRHLESPKATTLDVFVGRRRERNRIRQAIQESRRGRGVHLQFTGAAGIGRSALLRVAGDQIAASGMPAWEIGASRAPLALVTSLMQFYQRWSPGLAAADVEHAQQLTTWKNQLRKANDSDDRLNANAMALTAMHQIAASHPHAILCDDSQSLDPLSQEILRLMVVGAQDLGILLITSARTPDTTAVPSDETLEDAQEWQGQSAREWHFVLQEFTRSEAALLVSRCLAQQQPPPGLVEHLYSSTHGHPLHAVEALRYLVQEEVLQRHATGWQLQDGYRVGVPQQITDISVHRLEFLRRLYGDTIRNLALLPEGATVQQLAALVDVERQVVESAVEAGVSAGFLQVENVPPVVRFRLEIVREAYAKGIPLEAARRLHSRMAQLVEEPLQIAHHLLLAGNESGEARTAFLAAAQTYRQQQSPHEALRFLQSARDIPGHENDVQEIDLMIAELQIQVGETDAALSRLENIADSETTPLVQARHRRVLAEAQTRLGNHGNALQHLQAAADLMQQVSTANELCSVHVDIARLLTSAGEYAKAAASASRARHGLPATTDSESLASLMLAQAWAEQQAGDHEAAESTARATLELLKPLGRTRQLAQAHTLIGMTYYFRGDFTQAERFHRAALQGFRERRDLLSLMQAQNNLGMAQMRAGKLQDAVGALEESLSLKRQLGDLRGQGSGFNNLGNLWERQGQYVRALHCYRHGIRIFRRLRRPTELATLTNNMGEVYMRVGRLPVALRHFEKAHELCRNLGAAFIALAVEANRGSTLLQLRDHRRALAVLQAGLQLSEDSGVSGMAARFHAWIALANHLGSDSDAARHHAQQARHRLSDCDAEAQVDVLLSLAELALSVNDPHNADVDAKHATVLAREESLPYAQAWGERLQASASLQQGDWDRAESTARDARSRCQELGFRNELARCDKLLGLLHWDLGLRARAHEEFELCFAQLEELGLKVELGLSYLEVARLTHGRGPTEVR